MPPTVLALEDTFNVLTVPSWTDAETEAQDTGRTDPRSHKLILDGGRDTGAAQVGIEARS